MAPPSGVSGFIKWPGGKAKAAWIDGGNAGGNPCGPMSAHGFMGRAKPRRSYRDVCEDTMIVVEAQKEIASFRDDRRGHFALASLTLDHALSALW
ncbi:hypothetical protein [Bradyrhizobium retamae]|uniref:hypothetical protein n=1 Tax=Bradyrhizobium retamae TaxID=1300035 RepID=UPI000ACB1F89|nr:hypothetical protein [Bradyrhizobium retamae]